MADDELKAAVAQADLDRALALAQAAVRSDPAASRHRIALFQLQCVLGQWERANTQLDAIRELDASALPMVTTYGEAIKCEAVRARVFAGQTVPMAFGAPEAWLAWMVEAVHADARGEGQAAAELRARALEAAQDSAMVSGTIDDTPFEWLADADSRLGPLIEAIVNGKYYWMPVTALASLDIDPPEDLRDFVWAPAHFTFVNGGETVGLIPARYPGSEASADALVRLGRKTEWQPLTGEAYAGLGQRLMATDVDEYPLLSIRRISFSSSAAAG